MTKCHKPVKKTHKLAKKRKVKKSEKLVKNLITLCKKVRNW